MNTDINNEVNQEDKPLTRADVEELLRRAGSSDKLELAGLNLRGIDLTYFHLDGANLSGANLSGANLSGADLSRAVLKKANLSRANLIGANFSRANLIGTNLIGADLIGANLSRANLNEADLTGANLSRANLIRANLSRANLIEADLTGADLTEIDIIKVNYSTVVDLDEPKAPTAKIIPTFSIRIIEEPLTPHNLTSIISAITDLSTKCWLMANKRLTDLIEYMQTHDVRFIEESKLIITKITYNSPFEANFKIDLSASNIAEAITTTIDGVIQAKQRLEKAELENKEKAQEIEHAKQKADQENKAGLLELEQKELAIERERLEILEKRLDVQKKGIEYALEIAAKTVTVHYPQADEQTKAMLMQTLLPTILQLQNGKGLELVLPVPQTSEKKEQDQR